MNEVMKNLLTRRSVRAFLDENISKDILMELARAGAYAPSGRGLQTWKFTIVCNRERIQELAHAIAGETGREVYHMYRPAAIIVPSNKADSFWGRDDNACALENIFLAAHSYNIGSVWINQLHGICDRPAIRNILTSWGIPEDHVVYGLAALGYPRTTPPKEVIKTGEIQIID